MWKKIKEYFWFTPMMWTIIFLSIITYGVPFYYKVIFILLAGVIDCLFKIYDSLNKLIAISIVASKSENINDLLKDLSFMIREDQT